MTDHFSSERNCSEWREQDLLKCYGCGVRESNQTPVFLVPHDPDPSTWEKNPPTLCAACRKMRNNYTTVYTNNPEKIHAPFGMFKNVEASKKSFWQVWCVWHSPQQEVLP